MNNTVMRAAGWEDGTHELAREPAFLGKRTEEKEKGGNSELRKIIEDVDTGRSLEDALESEARTRSISHLITSH